MSPEPVQWAPISTRRLHICGLLALCVIGTGVEWDFLQVFAWGRMIAENSRTMSMAAAVKQAFDGEMCPICDLVARAKRQEQSRPSLPEVKMEGKMLLFFQAPKNLVIEAPRAMKWLPARPAAPIEISLAPPVPPPRRQLA